MASCQFAPEVACRWVSKDAVFLDDADERPAHLPFHWEVAR
jgi:hypothetical protein